MKNLSRLAIVGLMGLGLAGMVTPTLAASIASCQDDVTINPTDSGAGAGTYTQYINANAGAIQAALNDKGIKASSVTDWGGCVEARVTNSRGQTINEFFDPDTLQRLSVNG